MPPAIPTTPTATRLVPTGLEQQAAALADGSLLSTVLVERAIAAAVATEGRLRAFARLRTDAARREAADADRRLAAGERAPLLGVPVAVKDDTDVAGEPTPFGCAGEWPAAADDAEVVRRLRAAGAVIVGKTTTPELGQWPFTESVTYGVTRNPWDTAYSPGGSSGGSAAAVAAGVVAAAVGSDGAGSVRIPAAWTHLVGVKPERGRVSSWPHPDAFHGLTTHGVLARTTADAALLLDAIRGSHPRDRHRAWDPAEPFVLAARREPGRLRIGVSTSIPFSLVRSRLDPYVEDATWRIAGVLEALGHDVGPKDIRWGVSGGFSFLPRSFAGLDEWHRRAPDPSALDRRTRANCRKGALVGAPLLSAAQALEAVFAHRLRRVFADLDVVLSPTTASPPLPVGACDGLGGRETDQVSARACPLTWPWNVLGWPAVNVPAGFTAGGLPIGVQLLGPRGSEARLLSLAAQLEAAERWDLRWPPGGPSDPPD